MATPKKATKARRRSPARRAVPERKQWTPEELQTTMLLIHRLAGIPEPTPEHKFAWADARRKWSIDYAWPSERIALEVEGRGHQRDNRYYTDIEKYNELSIRGWILIRATYDMLPTPDFRRDSAVLPLLQRAFAYRQAQVA